MQQYLQQLVMCYWTTQRVPRMLIYRLQTRKYILQDRVIELQADPLTCPEKTARDQSFCLFSIHPEPVQPQTDRTIIGRDIRVPAQ